jgi:transcriptional regulator with XRE-family HTH domain
MPAIDADRLLKNLGRRIAEVRVERRLTQDLMAEELGISMKYLQRLERGRNMSLTTLVGIANKLRVGLDELLLTAATSKVKVGRPPKAAARRSGRRPSS